MKPALRRPLILLLLFAFLSAIPAEAQTGGIGPTKSQVIGIGIAIAAVGAAIGIGTYFLIRRPPSVTGCALSGPDGLVLHGENNQTFLLLGDTSAIKPGDRVRVEGHRKKRPTGVSTFQVNKLSKDFGPCPAQYAAP